MTRRFYAPWALHDGGHVDLIEPSHLADLSHGTRLVSISGEFKVVGTDLIDGDTRGGMLAWGFPCFAQHGGDSEMGTYYGEDWPGVVYHLPTPESEARDREGKR